MRSKVTVTAMSPRALSLTPAATALVTVECQNGIIGPDGALPALAAAAAPVVPAIGRLADAVRRVGGRVVHLTFVPALDNRSSNRAPVLFNTVLDLMKDWTPEHPAAQVVREIGVGQGDLVLPRHSGLSPTKNTELFPMLRNAGVTTVVLAGVSLNIALPVVATDAVDEGLQVVIPRDAVAATPPEYGPSVLRHTLSLIATISTVDDIVGALA